ncbi:Glycosyltransferase, GT2 family [Arthrobacter sp. VKM Ac-2550]|nr:Glycosyltransferase, GT2 family [Arthrobacter sp. VKM Ac-2550]
MISVGIPYTDQGEMLAEAIQSVLTQTTDNWELILFGDAPNAETESVAFRFQDERIRHYKSEKRQGLAATLNELVKLARGEYFARMDGDDIMFPNRLEVQADHLLRNPKIDVVGTHAYLIDDSGCLVGGFVEPELPLTSNGFLTSNAFTHPTVLGKTDWFIRHPYDESLLRGQDKELWLRTSPTSSFDKLTDRLLYYRVSRAMDAKRQKRNSEYDRIIIEMYSFMAKSRWEIHLRKAKSLVKQQLFALLTRSGLSNVLYARKAELLSEEEFSAASRQLTNIQQASRAGQRPSVLAVTVTYGDRFDLVRRTVESALEAGCSEVLVVDNGSEFDNSTRLNAYFSAEKKVIVTRLTSNEGSAPGYSAGVGAALETSHDFFWLLDDDNVITQGNVDSMWNTHRQLKTVSDVAGVAAFRTENPRQARVVEGIDHVHAYPPSGSFLYFDALHFMKRKFLRARPNTRFTHTPEIPVAPYGGLFLDRESVGRIGLPDMRFGLYEDDSEWTSRIALQGRLVLQPGVIVDDIDTKWTQEAQGIGPARIINSSTKGRIYFAVRNRVYLDNQVLRSKSTRIRYYFNKRIYLLITRMLANSQRSSANFDVLRRAVQAGEAGDFQISFTPVEKSD